MAMKRCWKDGGKVLDEFYEFLSFWTVITQSRIKKLFITNKQTLCITKHSILLFRYKINEM